MVQKSQHWSIAHEVEEYSNEYFTIVKQDVQRPDNTRGVYYTLKRPSPFSIIIPLTSDDQTYIVGQYRIPSQYYSWEFAMGGVAGKKPLGIAKQELKEELGMTADSWEEIGSFYAAHGHTDSMGHVFIARDLHQGDAEPEPGEILTVRKLPIADVGTMIAEKKILDGPTITAWHFYTQHKTK